MPQTTNPTTAPPNPAPRWPAGYIEVLRDAGAQEKTIPFCVGWVSEVAYAGGSTVVKPDPAPREGAPVKPATSLPPMASFAI